MFQVNQLDKIIIGVVVAIFLVIGISRFSKCGGKASSTGEAPSAAAAATGGGNTLYIFADSLKLRAGAGKNDSSLVVLYKGQPVTYMGERTNSSEKINLDGREYNEYRFKVKTTDGKIGWIYGGGVRFYK